MCPRVYGEMFFTKAGATRLKGIGLGTTQS